MRKQYGCGAVAKGLGVDEAEDGVEDETVGVGIGELRAEEPRELECGLWLELLVVAFGRVEGGS